MPIGGKYAFALAELVRLKRIKERIDELEDKEYSGQFRQGRRTADEEIEMQQLKAEYARCKRKAWDDAKAAIAPCQKCGRAYDKSCWRVDCPRHEEKARERG